MVDLNQKSGSEVAQKNRSRGRDLDYWKKRLVRRRFSYEGETKQAKDWSVRIQHAGRRQFFNLGTPNREAAAVAAKKIAAYVQAHGWVAAEREFRQAEEKARIKTERQMATVGTYLDSLMELAAEHRTRTLAAYAGCLRRLVGDIISRGGRKPDRKMIDQTPLAVLTDDEIEKWKAARIRACEGNPIAEDTAKITANSILRNCRAAFGRKLLNPGRREALRRSGLVLPDPLPFSRVALFEEDTSGKFTHDVGVEALVRAAAADLSGPRREGEGEGEEEFESRQQQFVAFLLVFAAGLRKGEADTLEWTGIDLEAGTVTVRTTEYFRPKTKASQRPVRLDPEAVEALRRYRAVYRKDQFVLRSPEMPRPSSRHAYYRCELTWSLLSRWLAAQGVRDSKPIHYLRKASAAFVARKFGIFAAQRHARHTTPAITQRYYSDSDETVAPGFGGLFSLQIGPPNQVNQK